jgi:L(+)-tartrate dehydratase beta subunit
VPDHVGVREVDDAEAVAVPDLAREAPRDLVGGLVGALQDRRGLLPEALEPLQEHGGVYLAIVGGAAALQTTQIAEIEQVEWEDLMPECLWRFRVEDFGPLIVAMDSHGRSLYEDVQAEARRRIDETLSAKI